MVQQKTVHAAGKMALFIEDHGGGNIVNLEQLLQAILEIDLGFAPLLLIQKLSDIRVVFVGVDREQGVVGKEKSGRSTKIPDNSLDLGVERNVDLLWTDRSG